MALNLRTIVSTPFQENTYIVWLDGRSDALVIDPGLEPDLVLESLQAERLSCAVILNTHGHADHIGGNKALKHAFAEAPLVIGAGDAPLLTDSFANLSAPFGFAVVSPPADRLVREGDRLDFAGIELEVLDIPGHSPGHVVFVYRDKPVRVFGGDVLFQGSIGRADLPGCDMRRLISGIQTKLFALPDDTIVYPGHGEPTTIGVERRTNPFVGLE
jgi:glyoxylase-like metal-dependent hydrolase (beta-lactamase superfamily II)